MTARHAKRILMSSALTIGLAGAAHAAPSKVPMDHAREVHGVKVACAGIGARDEALQRWTRYPVKLEFANTDGQYLAGERVALHNVRTGKQLSVRCEAPWVLMRLAPGQYRGTADLNGRRVHHLDFAVPAHGQRQIIVRYKARQNRQTSGA